MITACLALLLLQIAPEAARHIQAGMKAKASGDLETAIREFRRVAELAPELAAAHVNLGAAYLAKAEYAGAVQSLRRALELDPNLAGAHGMLGAALLAQGYGCESVTHLEKGGTDDLRGVALLECGRPREALERLEAALQKRPDDPDLLYYLARTHSELARQSAEKLRSQGPESARMQQLLGEAAADAGDRAKAMTHLRAAVAQRPDLRGVHLALGELLMQSGDYKAAEEELRLEAALSPGSAVTAWRLGTILANLGRTQEAIVELKRSDTLQPGMPETLLELGKVLVGSDDATAAEPYLQAVVRMEGDSELAEAAHFQLAQVYRKLGRTADAKRELTAFQKLRSSRSSRRSTER